MKKIITITIDQSISLDLALEKYIRFLLTLRKYGCADLVRKAISVLRIIRSTPLTFSDSAPSVSEHGPAVQPGSSGAELLHEAEQNHRIFSS